MLDLHNHVLFGLDDGCRTIEESAALAERAKRAGHAGFIATPHIRAGMFDNTVEAIRLRRDETRPVVEACGLELHLGAEYYFDERVLVFARARTLLTLGERSRFVLVEMPQSHLPPRLEDTLFAIRLAGYGVVVAHPERCQGVQSDLAAAEALFSHAGALLQLDLGSLIGSYGGAARRAAVELVKRGAYHVAACDLHRPDDVDVLLPSAVEELAALLKRRRRADVIDTLLEENPRKILANAALEDILPV